MAPMKPGNNLDKWRDYFRASSSDIFDIIECGIKVAASDCPQEFRKRRDRIAEILFSAKLSKCVGCDSVALFVPGEEDEACEIGDGCELEAGGTKESKVDSGVGDHGGEMNVNQTVSNYSYGDAEALTDEIEQASQIFGEVLRIKEILQNSEDESDSLLFESLRRLQLMALSVETLKVTEIGKAVNALRKHASKDIRDLARILIEGWKFMVDEWVSATAIPSGTSEGCTPESVNPSVVDEEEGLPSPPLDDLAFFVTQPPTSMELSQFFDGMDDDENNNLYDPGNNWEISKNRESGRKPTVASHNIPKQRQPRLPIELVTPPKDKKDEQTRKQETPIKKQVTVQKPNKPSIVESGPGRPTKPCLEQKGCNETKLQQKPEKVAIQRPPVSQQHKSRGSGEPADQEKLEATKRKLQERYQQVENAKRQRTIQVMELNDLPKQGLGRKNQHVRPGNNHNRYLANGRR